MPFLPRVSKLGLLASLGLSLAAVPPPAPALAEPMRLADPRPRWVGVRFEASAEGDPGRLDACYGEELPAWLEPDAETGRVRVTIPAREVETRLMADQGARPGSLSDFTWLFDARTGDVLSASLTGVLVRRIGVGFLRFDTEVEIRSELSTLVAAGFRRPEDLLGERVIAYCEPSEEEGCTAVPAAPYDPHTGYVNAVGSMSGRALSITTRSFSSLGEARFEERDATTLARADWEALPPGPPAVSAAGPGDVRMCTPAARRP